MGNREHTVCEDQRLGGCYSMIMVCGEPRGVPRALDPFAAKSLLRARKSENGNCAIAAECANGEAIESAVYSDIRH
ncbi:hypothetical protein QG37_06017 [Candidozyma auris]|nr:hypothetical protein QG37_06017 [[Candida] auris]